MRKKLEIPPVEAISPRAVLVVGAGGKIFYGILSDDPAGKALMKNLSPVTLKMCDCGDSVTAGVLPWKFPQSDGVLTAAPGDVVLFDGDKIGLCRREVSGRFARAAKIGSSRTDELLKALGEGEAIVSLSLEWGE